jgi:putative component of toxin-antitoxin plasmid stabilization module
VTEWIESLPDSSARNRLTAQIELLRSGMPTECRQLGNNVYVVRLEAGPDSSPDKARKVRLDAEHCVRLYFGRKGESLLLLLCGAGSWTKAAERDSALAFMADFETGARRDA